MTWSSAVNGWVAWLSAGGRARGSVRLRRYQVLRLAADVGGRPGSLTAGRLASWLAVQVWAIETRRSEVAGLRSFFGWLRRAGVRVDDPTDGLPALRPPEGVPRPADERAVAAALLAADGRTRLMVELAAWHGLRRGEIAMAAAWDMTVSSGGWSLRVHGKGGKDRMVPLLDSVAAKFRLSGSGWVFPNGFGDHLTAGHVGVLISRVLPVGVTPHMLRHRFATVVYRRTLDIRNLQRLLGHSSVATTQRYAAPDDAVLRAVLTSASAA